MVRGDIIDDKPWVKIVIAGDLGVQGLLVKVDTGFTGELKVSGEVADELGLEINYVQPTQYADGRVKDVPVSLAVAEPEKGSANIEVKVVSVKPFKVIACRHVGPHKGLFRAYGDLYSWAEKTGWVKSLKGIYGLPIDDPRGMPEKECRFDCCFDFGADVKPGEGLREEFLGGGRYAVARHLGPYEGLEDKYDYLYGPWLNASGYLLREKPFFNHYLQDPETLPPEEWQTDIYLPIEKGEQK